MPLDSLEFRISLQKLLAALIVVLVPLTVFGLYIALHADQQSAQMNGAYLRSITHAAAATATEFVGQHVVDVSVIANEPTLMQSVTSANRSYEHLNEQQIRAKTEQLESKWNSSETDQLAKNILTSDLARVLRRYQQLNPRLLRIAVADEVGGSVAATDKPTHYLQPDRDYWQSLPARGQGAVYVSEVRYDEQSRSNYISIGYPVLQEGTGRFVGAVTALIDVSPLFTYFNQQQFAQTGRVSLINDAGIVIYAPDVNPSLKLKSEEYSAIRDALGTPQGRTAGYMHARLPGGVTHILGFADTGLKQSYPNLGWIVVASQDEREAGGPVRNLAHFALLVLILAVLMLTLLCAYVYLHQKQQMADLEIPNEPKRPAAA